MAQSTVVALVIVAAWLIFITARGKLPSYMAVFGLTQGSAATKSVGDTSAASGAASAIGSGLDVLNPAASLGRALGRALTGGGQ